MRPYFGLRSYTDNGEHYERQIGSEAMPGEYTAALLDCTREWMRVLKPVGSIFVILGDRYAARPGAGPNAAAGGRNVSPAPKTAVAPKSLYGTPWRYALGCVEDLGLILRAEVIWSKPNGLPESVTDRVRRSHEQIFHFTKSGRYFAAVDGIREPHQPQSIARTRRNRFAPDLSQTGVGSPNTLNPADACNPLGRLPGSVWEIPSAPLRVPEHIGVKHFAAYPPEIVRRIILGWAPSAVCTRCGEGRRPLATPTGEVGRRPGGRTRVGKRTYANLSKAALRPRVITGYACACPDASAPTRPAVVLDPFGGTGTTALVADVLGRTGITVDRSADYCRLAAWRTRDPRERARVLALQGNPAASSGAAA